MLKRFKSALMLFIMLTTVYAGKAQMVALSESFDGTTFPPTGWTYLGTGWSRQTTGTNPTVSPRTGAGFARFNAFSLSSGTTGTLITPSYELLNRGANSATVSFWMYRDNGYNTTTYDLEGITVYVNTSASLTGATSLGFIPRRIGAAPTVAANGWYQYTFNVPASFTGANNYMILHARSSFGNNIFIDDVSWQTYPANRNIGVSGILNPVGGNCGNPGDTIKVTVTNYSIYSASNFNIRTEITGTINNAAVNSAITSSYSGTLAAGASVNLAVGVISNLQNGGNINISSFTQYANDLTKTNDTTKANGLTFNRRPSGAAFAIGNAAKGILNAGTMASKDVVKGNDITVYSLGAPTSYTVAGYGTTWNISSISLRSASNGALINTPTITPGSASVDIRLSNPLAYVDSAVRLDITLQDMSTGCDFSYSRYIYIAPTPKPIISVGKTCEEEVTAFENLSTISSGTMTFEWDYGDPAQDNEGDQNRVYRTPGTYTVRLTATSNYGFSEDTTMNITVHPAPVADFTVQHACEGSAVSFTNNSSVSGGTISSSVFSFGDGNSSSSTTYTYANPGNYNVTLTVTSNNGCIATRTRRAIQYAKPDVDFSLSSMCSNKEIQFVNTGSSGPGHVFFWDFDDLGTSTSENPKHSYATSGNKDITLRVMNANHCMDSIVKTVMIENGPVVSFNASNLCSASPVKFTNNSTHDSGAVFMWNFGTMGSSPDQSPEFQFMPGNHKISLKVVNPNGCEAMIEQNILVRVQPKVQFRISDDSICSGESFKIVNETEDNGSVISYNWDFGNGTGSLDESPSVDFNTNVSQTYTIRLVAGAAQGCSDSASRTIFVSKLPSCDFTIASDLTGERRFTFTAAEAGNSNTWSFGDGVQATGKSNLHQFIFDGVYTIILTSVNQTGCVCQSSQTLSVFKMSVSETEDKNIRIYPNPNDGRFNIAVDVKVSSIGIYNTLGELVSSVNITDNANNTFSADLSGLSSGVYYVKVQTENGVLTKKVSVTR